MKISTLILILGLVCQAQPADDTKPAATQQVAELESRIAILQAELDDCLAAQAAPTTGRKFRVYRSLRELLARMPKEYTKPTRWGPVDIDGVNGWMFGMRGQVFEAILTCSATQGGTVQFSAPPERVGKMHFQLQLLAYLKQPGQQRSPSIKLGQTYHINGIIASAQPDTTMGYNPMIYFVELINCRVRPAPKHK